MLKNVRCGAVTVIFSGIFSSLTSGTIHAEPAPNAEFVLAPNAGFLRIPKYDEIRNQYEIEDMPRYRDQDKVGFCSAFAASVALDKAYCETNGIKCSEASDEHRVSVLQLSTFSYTPRGTVDGSYSNPFETISMATKKAVLRNEAECPFERLVAGIPTKPGFDKEDSHEMAWLKLLNDWESFAKIDEGDPVAVKKFIASSISGPDGVLNNFNLNKTPNEVLEAFKKPSAQQMYECLFIKYADLREWDVPLHLGLAYYPPSGVTGNYAATIKEVKKRINFDVPVLVSRYFVNTDYPTAFKNRNVMLHAFAISGYREVRHGEKWLEMVKVHNSWGERWQRKNDGGWVDAKSLLDRTRYEAKTLGWITMPDHQRILPKDKEPIIFNIPENWKSAKGRIPEIPWAQAYILNSPAARNAKCSISIEYSEMNSAETDKSLKKFLSDDCKPYLSTPNSLSQIEFNEIKLKEGSGLYMNFIDPDMIGKPVKIGDYKTVTPLVSSMGSKYLVRATMFCDDINGEDYRQIMKMFKTMSLKR